MSLWVTLAVGLGAALVAAVATVLVGRMQAAATDRAAQATEQVGTKQAETAWDALVLAEGTALRKEWREHAESLQARCDALQAKVDEQSVTIEELARRNREQAVELIEMGTEVETLRKLSEQGTS